MISKLRADMKKLWKAQKADFMQRYFKSSDVMDTKDIFRGLSVPESRIIAKQYKDLSISDIQRLLISNIHEERLIALFILVHQFQKGDDLKQKKIYDFYLEHTQYINQWDLVDSSADRILGAYLKNKPREVLYKLAMSKNWWERRIAIIATYQFIKDLKEYTDTFKIAQILLEDKHDLIQKAVGWMLREVGNRVSQQKEEEFLKHNYIKMPRTMLRFAIEKFPPEKRTMYLLGKIN
jgi:3-methyladenine DNA glycosylase AlkD